MSLLLPEGIESIVDAPHTWHEVVTAALRFLRWEDNLPGDEMPPKRIWLDGAKLEAWWHQVNKARDEKYGLDRDRDPEEDPNAVYEDNDLSLIAHG